MRDIRIFLRVAYLSACQQTAPETAANPATPVADAALTPPATVEPPDSRAGRVARQLLDLIHHGDAAASGSAGARRC